jgi:DNA-binding transcriptional LysR family regulator
VGRRLASLESALGAKLFVRGPTGFTLTPAGSEIVSCVEAIAAQVEAIQRRGSGGDARVEGVVRVTMPESANRYMMQRLAPLRERHPNLVIEILSDNRELDIRRGEADIALRFRDSSDAELVVRKIGIVGWALYASPAYVDRKGRVAVDNLPAHDVVGFDASLAGALGAVWLRERGCDSNIVLRGNNLAAVASAVSAGLGVAPLPCFVADGEPAMQRVSDIIGRRDILLVVHPDLARVARVRATMDFLIEVFAKDAALWSGVS